MCFVLLPLTIFTAVVTRGDVRALDWRTYSAVWEDHLLTG